MKRICSFLAASLMVVAQVVAQPIAPTVKITCAVNYAFVQNYAKHGKSVPSIAPQGDYFSGSGFFVTRQSIDLYPKKTAPSGTYKVTIDAATRSFISHACSEPVSQVLDYIDTHEFGTMQNVFYLGAKSSPLPSRVVERRIGDWTLASWDNPVDRPVD